MSRNQCKALIQEFASTQEKYKNVSKKYDEKKKKFYADMDAYFKQNKISEDGLMIESDGDVPSKLFVKKIQAINVIFDADKLENRLPKKYVNDVIHKKYHIIDMQGLITYLKECGVDANTFKKFISTDKKVDTDELERLEKIGEISADDIKGCYTVNVKEPYFKVTNKKVKGDKD